MASQGKIRFDTLAELINFTLGRLTTTPLLCIDDADALDTVGNPDHAVLMRLWDGLRLLTTRIIIGRQMVLNTDQYLPVRSLSVEETARFFALYDIECSDGEVKRYHRWTQGNLRLLRLCCSISATAPEKHRSSNPRPIPRHGIC